MLIVDAYSEHAGQYCCKAANSAGEAARAATLTGLQTVKEAQLASKTLPCCTPAPPTVTNESLCCVSQCLWWLVHHLLTVPPKSSAMV